LPDGGEDYVTRWVVALVIGLLAFAQDVCADKAKARELIDKASKQYNLGEYTAAAAAFKAAYDEFPDPSLLYNLAQCERQLSHKARAITLYRSYLREASDPPNAADVRRLIALLEQDLRREEQARKLPPEGTLAQPPPSTASGTTQPPPSVAPSSLPRAWWRNPAGWALVGVGAAVAAAGGGLLVASAHDQDSAPRAPTLADARAQLDQANTFRMAGFALVGVGAASALAGALVLALTPSRWKAHAALVPAAGGALVTIGGSL